MFLACGAVRLLVITQTVDRDDPILGFFHEWLVAFARRVEKLTVLCLNARLHDLPNNTEVLSLGKDEGKSRLTFVARLYRLAWARRHDYDVVFVHMNQIYVVLGGWLFRLLGKRIVLWYAHRATSASLRVAEMFSHRVVTSTESGFRIPSNKKIVVGQGIDTDLFRAAPRVTRDVPVVVSVGRISPVKGYDTLLPALGALLREGVKLRVRIVGDAGLPEHRRYQESLKNIAREEGLVDVEWVAAVPNRDVVEMLQQADLFVNASSTGSLDKAILEAMATETPVLTCNEAANEILGAWRSQCTFDRGSIGMLAERIRVILELSADERRELGRSLRDVVVRNHTIDSLVTRILDVASESAS